MINSHILYAYRDNVPTIKLGEWPLLCNMWDGEILAGPVPTLFADTPDVDAHSLKSDMGKAHYDLNRLHRVFVGHEHIELKEALALVKKPR
jgi:hypothetical protein